MGDPYQVLARKWRPRSFETLVGQEHVVRALTHALTENRLHHAYLFTGTRGVGKTTIARIMAKALNCEKGVSATPCGQCTACTEIDGGRFIDYIELDAASNRGVDEMTQLLESAAYAPTAGRYKVYVIDEVHQLSGHAFNAMLKTLEEPPEHVKFILATTDPQKIPVTVLSRCMQFNLKQMPPALIAGHLKQILEEEKIAAEPAALNLLSRSAAGSMRDALSLLDQAIAHGGGSVSEAQVREMLGTVDLDYLFSVFDALLANDAAGLLRVTEDMALRSLSFSAALQELASLMTRVQMAQFAPESVAEDAPERARLLDLAARLDPEYVQLAYQIAVQGRAELYLAPDEQDGFMMTLLRLFAFRPAEGDEAPPRAAPAAPIAGRAKPAPRAEAKPAAAPRPATPPAAAAPKPEPEPESPGVAVPAAPESPGVAAGETGDWPALLASLNVNGLARELGQHCLARSIESGAVVLCLAPEHRHVLIKSAQEKLQQALSEHFGRPVRLTVEIDEVSGETPADAARRQNDERQKLAAKAIDDDLFVTEAIDKLGATVVKSSIKPV